MSSKIPFIWSNDDIANGKPGSMERQLKFLHQFGIKGSFFVIPCYKQQKITEDEKLINQKVYEIIKNVNF